MIRGAAGTIPTVLFYMLLFVYQNYFKYYFLYTETISISRAGIFFIGRYAYLTYSFYVLYTLTGLNLFIYLNALRTYSSFEISNLSLTSFLKFSLFLYIPNAYRT